MNNNIIITDEISDIKDIVMEADENTLFISDCIDVLLESEDRILQADNKTNYQFLKEKYFSDLSESDKRYYMAITQIETKYKLLDSEWPKFIKDLQERDVKTILLTSAPVGKIGKFNFFEDTRYNILLEQGIDFKKSWKDISPIAFVDLSCIVKGIKRCPVFKNGILLTDYLGKDILLDAFLRRNPLIKINKIIFIDDKMKHISAIDKVAKIFSAQYIGINYTKSLTLERKPIDMQIAEKQMQFLSKYQKWIADKAINGV